MTKTKTIYKLKWKNLFRLVITLLYFIFITFIFIIVINLYSDYRNTDKMIETLKRDIKITNLVDDKNTIVEPVTTELSKFDPYWNYIKMSFIDINMADLKKINNDTIGWIQIKNTDFNYPVVKRDNSFYQSHSFDEDKNDNGWIYLDKKNSIKELDKITTINCNKRFINNIYNSLKVVTKKPWLDNNENYVIKYYTNKYSTLWQIVSVYEGKSDISDTNFEEYKHSIIDKSKYDFKTEIENDDKILTIKSIGKKSNLYIHAKLLKTKINY